MKYIRCTVVALMLTPAIGAAQDFDAEPEVAELDDYPAALQKWMPLAEQGDAKAQYILGNRYSTGWGGVPRDEAEALRWYRLAAEQGDAKAQFNVGARYSLGRGVIQDFVTGYMWLNIAAANGSDIAAENRARVIRQMTPATIAEAQRRARICIESGYPDCD